MLSHTIPCYLILSHAILCYPVLSHAITCYLMLSHAIPCYPMLLLSLRTVPTLYRLLSDLGQTRGMRVTHIVFGDFPSALLLEYDLNHLDFFEVVVLHAIDVVHDLVAPVGGGGWGGLSHANPCYPMLSHANPCYLILSHAILCYIMLSHAILCYHMLSLAI